MDNEWRIVALPPGDAKSGSEFWAALRDAVGDINGFVYSGERTDAIIDTIKYLRTHPAMVKKLIIKKVEDSYDDHCDPENDYHSDPHICCILR
jgi:N-acetylneuraminic acid mutarotase